VDDKRRSKLIEELYTRPPISGTDFRVKAVEELLRDGSPEAVSALEEAVSRSTNKQIQQIALDGLSTLAHEGYEGPAQEALCRLVTEKGNLVARDITVANGYMPKELHQKVLFFFFTEQWDKYEKIDIDNRFIKSIYESADDITRKRIMSIARQAGRIELAFAATGGRKGRRLSEMTEEEWNAVISILESRKQWNELWLLAQKGPPFFSLKIIHKLKYSGWAPLHGDVYKKLVQIADQLDEELPALTSLAWPLLKESVNRVVTLKMSPDGRMFARWKNESVVCLWSRSKDITFEDRDRPSRKPFAMSTKGGIIAIGNCLWRKPYCGSLNWLSSGYSANVLAIAPDEKTLAMGNNKNILLWSLPDGKLFEILEGYSKIIALAISQDGQLLISGDDNNKINLWSLPDGKLLKTFEGQKGDTSEDMPGRIAALAISHDGQLFVSGGDSFNNRTNIWSIDDGKLLKTIEQSSYRLAITPDGKVLISENGFRGINLWSLPDGKLLKNLVKIHQSHIQSLHSHKMTISTEGGILADIYDKAVHLWSLPEGRLIKILKLPEGFIVSLLINHGVKILTYLSRDNTIRFWDTNLILMIPVIQMTLQDIRSIEEASKIDDVSKVEKNWLEFVLELVLSNRQYDILIEETIYPIETDEFDIIID
jgi:hypothetical protein